MIASYRNRLVVIVAAALLAVSLPAAVCAQPTMIQPNSPQAAQTIARLEHAAHVDRQEYKNHSGGEESDLGIYYAHKAKEAEALARKLKSGKAVSQADVDRALNTQQASHFRAY